MPSRLHTPPFWHGLLVHSCGCTAFISAISIAVSSQEHPQSALVQLPHGHVDVVSEQ